MQALGACPILINSFQCCQLYIFVGKLLIIPFTITCQNLSQFEKSCYQHQFDDKWVGNTEPFQKECRSALLAPLRAGPLQICYFVMMQVSGMWFCYKKPIDERLARLRRNCSVHMTKNLPVSQICGKRTFFNREPLIVCCWCLNSNFWMLGISSWPIQKYFWPILVSGPIKEVFILAKYFPILEFKHGSSQVEPSQAKFMLVSNLLTSI